MLFGAPSLIRLGSHRVMRTSLGGRRSVGLDLKSVIGVVLLLVGIILRVVLGVYVLSPALSQPGGAGRSNQVEVLGTLPSSVSGATSISFQGRTANGTSIDTSAQVDTSGHFTVVVLGGVSYQIYAGGNGQTLCYSTLYVPTGTTTFAQTIAC